MDKQTRLAEHEISMVLLEFFKQNINKYSNEIEFNGLRFKDGEDHISLLK